MKKVLSLLLIVLVALSISACGTDEKKAVLNVYNWGEYIDESIIDDFEKETGVIVNYETFATNEDLYVKIKAGGSDYDLIFPSDYMIEKMIDEDLLQKINMDNIPNYKNIDEKFTGLAYDPNNEYSVPYFWGTVGILYNKDMVDEEVDSWNILWDENYKNSILMLDSQRDSLAVALKKLGYSMNTRNEAELEEAKTELIKQKPIVLAYVVDEVKDKMLGGEAALAVAWSGDAAEVSERGNFGYVVPKEGSNYWFDAVAMPKNAKNIKEAEMFIDFLSRPDIAARNADYIGYSTPNQEALKLLPEEVANNPIAYPDSETLENCEIFKNPGDFINVYDRIWTEVIASN